MTYLEFKTRIHGRLRKTSSGLTWNQLRDALDLPYERPCPEWVKRLESEIGLARSKASGKGSGQALVWRVK